MVRTTVLAIAFVVVVLAVTVRNKAQAAEQLDAKTIKWALHASEEENQGFVERVVKLMNDGRLSRASVTIAFGQARKQVKHQFQYFKSAMTELADREGVSLAQPEIRARPTTTKNWWERFVARLRRLPKTRIHAISR